MDRIAFDEKELLQVGEYPVLPGPGTLPKYDFPLAPRDNFMAAVKDRDPLWLPNYYDTVALCPLCYPDSVARGFVMGPEGAAYADDSMKGGVDSFGVLWEYVPVANGSMVKPGFAVLDDLNDWKEKVILPDVESWDWEGSKVAFADYLKGEKAVKYMWIFTGLFERLISLMDFENAAIALIDEDQADAVHEFLSACCDSYEKIIKHYAEDFDGDVLYFHDDWGSQRSPFFSTKTVMEMLVPHLKRLVDYTHSQGMLFEMHSCGCNEMLIPCYVEAGVDMWAPQQQNDFDKIIELVDGRFAVGLWDNAAAELSDEEKYEAGKTFATKYCKDFKKHPVYNCNLWDVEEKFMESVYVESRKLFCA